MAAIPTTDRCAWQASAYVLTDPVLWRCITSFQRGIPLPLYDFWVAHEPKIARQSHSNWLQNNLYRLPRLIASHGTVALLKMLSDVCRENGAEWEIDYLSSVSHDAIEAYRPDLLEWAPTNIAHHDKLETLWRTAIKKRRWGDNRALDALRIHKPITVQSLQTLTAHIVDVDFLRWLDLHFPGAIGKRTMENAGSERKLEVVQYILEHHPTMEFGGWPFQYASQRNEIAMLRCLFEKPPTQVERDFVKKLIEFGKKEERAILRDVGGFEDLAREVAQRYVDNGNVDYLQRLINDGLLPSGEPFSIDHAAASGHLDMVKLLEKLNLATATTNAMDWAAERKKWDVVKYLHEHRSEGCTTRVMDAAAKQWEFEELKFYHTNRSEGCSPNAMDDAAGVGALEIVEFLQENRTEGCTTRAIDAAASDGNLHVVKFLHEHRSEGCTAKAIEKAAKFGHLHVIKFLYFTRGERFTIDAVKKAIKHSKMEIVRFFYEHDPSVFGPELLHGLLLRGAFNIWMDLRAQYPDEANAVVEPVMFEAGKEYELATIHFVITGLGRDDLAHLAVDGAADEEFPDEDAEWVRAVMAVTGPQSCRLGAVRKAARVLSQSRSPTTVQYLISVCSESGAAEAAIASARENDSSRYLPEELEEWVENGSPLDLQPLHPFLLNPKCPTWVVHLVRGGLSCVEDQFDRCELPVPWAIHAVYNDDRAFLEYLHSLQFSDPLFPFEGARAAAIRKGNLPLLQWLLSDVDVPVESTLLDEALYYHQFEIAEWLVAKCADGCRELNWDAKVAVPWLTPCGLDDGVLLDWIENHEAVQSLVDFGAIAHHAVCCGDVSSLRVLHKTHPELYETREDLALTAKERGHDDVLSFLEEIQYAFMDGKRSANW